MARDKDWAKTFFDEMSRSEIVEDAIDTAIACLHSARPQGNATQAQELMRASQALVNLFAVRGEVAAIDAAKKITDEGTE